jgi:hypothetical protein
LPLVFALEPERRPRHEQHDAERNEEDLLLRGDCDRRPDEGADHGEHLEEHADLHVRDPVADVRRRRTARRRDYRHDADRDGLPDVEPEEGERRNEDDSAAHAAHGPDESRYEGKGQEKCDRHGPPPG